MALPESSAGFVDAPVGFQPFCCRLQIEKRWGNFDAGPAILEDQPARGGGAYPEDEMRFVIVHGDEAYQSARIYA